MLLPGNNTLPQNLTCPFYLRPLKKDAEQSGRRQGMFLVVFFMMQLLISEMTPQYLPQQHEFMHAFDCFKECVKLSQESHGAHGTLLLT